jgi:2-oxoglutarate dehydrogenase complex dihydrolipoamide succinyltransferase (E2) component
MPIEVKMPAFGLSIAEGTIEKWLKKEGDPIQKGEILVEITTEKVTVEIPAETSGVLLKILFPVGATVKVEEVIAIIGEAGETAKEGPGVDATAAVPAIPAAPLQAGRKEWGDTKVSPLALRIAEEHGVDIREVAARFPGEKIGKKEIFTFIEERKGKVAPKETPVAPAPIEEAEEVRPLSGPLRAMAEHMAMSTRTAARVTTMAEVDMTELVRLRGALKDKFKADYGVSLTYVPFVIKAICEGVREFPIINASLRGEEVILHGAVNVGLTVDTGESLLVPVIKGVAMKGIPDISREISQITTKARDGKLSLPDIQGGTISLTNAGVFGALMATPIIHQPQSAILWMGKVMETPVVREGKIVIRSVMYLCLSYDHRIIMGAQAVRFLQVVKKTLENPYPLLFS